jgi:hypothetical protein
MAHDELLYPPTFFKTTKGETHTHTQRERAGFVSFFSRYTKEADYFGSKNLVIRWGRTATFLSFLCCWLFYRIYKISLAPFFLTFFRKWRASAAASLNEARARTLAGAGIFFPSCFPFSSFYTSRRDERKCVSNVGNKHTDTLYPPLHLSNWNPSSFFTCLCNLLERGENRRKNCRKNK